LNLRPGLSNFIDRATKLLTRDEVRVDCGEHHEFAVGKGCTPEHPLQ
jgi:hypothetical protein